MESPSICPAMLPVIYLYCTPSRMSGGWQERRASVKGVGRLLRLEDASAEYASAEADARWQGLSLVAPIVKTRE